MSISNDFVENPSAIPEILKEITVPIVLKLRSVKRDEDGRFVFEYESNIPDLSALDEPLVPSPLPNLGKTIAVPSEVFEEDGVERVVEKMAIECVMNDIAFAFFLKGRRP